MATRSLLTCLIIFIVAASVSADGPNLLQNPGFEDGPDPSCASMGIYWDGPQTGCQPTIQYLDCSQRHSGSCSQRLGSSSTTDLGWMWQVSNYNTVQEGKTYRISAWIKCDVDEDWGWNVFRAEALYNDTSIAHINMPQQETTHFDWREIIIEYTVPYGSNVNRLAASLTRHWQNGTVWYDDVSIAEVIDGPPEITRSPASFDRTVLAGNDLTSDSFTVRNSGGDPLNYTITDNASWLSTTPSSGTSTGETDTILIQYDTDTLTAGTYNATITIADPNATNTPQTINVTALLRQPGDFDLDGDVDQEDYGVFQSCYTGPGIPQNDPGCAWAKMNEDVSVDQDDFNIFAGCMSGANVPADPTCIN